MALSEWNFADVRILARADDGSEQGSAAWGGVTVDRVAVRGLGSLISGRDLAEAFLLSPTDVLHVHSMWTCAERAMVNLVRRGVGVPYVFSPRGTLSPWSLAHKRWKKSISWPIWERVLVANAACVHALNTAEARMVRTAKISAPICIIPNGVWLPDDFAHEGIGGRRKLVFLGRLHPIKGIAELITGWSMLPSSIRDEWQLVLAGWDDSPEAISYRSMAAKLSPGSITFVGPVFGEAKKRLFKQADALILPSHSEGLPSVVLEAWSFGLPVIITEACNLSVGFRRGAAARIEPEAQSIAAVLEQFLTQPTSSLKQMGGFGRHLVEEKFSWKMVAAQMASVYRWMLGGEQPECIFSG
jgi:poly(glycerol-phosphate) alpha-glucosyltransferase